jgi:hypothetical protein
MLMAIPDLMLPSGIEELLDIRSGPADKIVSMFENGTIKHASEIMDFIVAHQHQAYMLGSGMVGTADFAMYEMDAGEPIVYLGAREANPLFKNNGAGLIQIAAAGAYIPGDEEIMEVKNSGSTIKARYSELEHLKEGMYGMHFISIAPGEHGSLHGIDRNLFERVFGQGDNFARNMEFYKDLGRESIIIKFLGAETINFLRSYQGGRRQAIIHSGFLSTMSSNNVTFLALDYRIVKSGYANQYSMIGVPISPKAGGDIILTNSGITPAGNGISQAGNRGFSALCDRLWHAITGTATISRSSQSYHAPGQHGP